jgi:hypothetical protein
MSKLYYFEDTRKNAKSSKPFAIRNKDVARTWTRDFNNDEGPFRPVDAPEGSEGQTSTEGETAPETGNGEATDDDLGSTMYDDMNNDERKAELDARGVEYPKNATKPELIKLLVEDDKTGGE